MQESLCLECIPWICFSPLSRMVRDLALKQGKEIKLKVEGENTELTDIIEKL